MSRRDLQHLTIHIRKDNLKFSAAHMTVFPDGSKENLHGHNYQVELTVELRDSPSLSQMLSYEVFKQALKTVCDLWDEHVLIAGANPWMTTLAADEDTYAFQLCGKRYLLPADEVVVLATDNITAENLAKVLFERFWLELTGNVSVTWQEQIAAMSLRIDESRGQGATYTVRFFG